MKPTSRLISWALVLCMLISLAGCSSGKKAAASDPDSGSTEAESAEKELICVDLMQNIQASVKPEARDLTAEEKTRITDFAVQLLTASRNASDNNLVSPLSVLCALSMTANGAKGETLQQMETVLGLPVEDLNACMAWYLAHLSRAGGGQLFPANSIWFSDGNGFVPNRAFLETNAAYYGADAYSLPFDKAACSRINEWVSRKTDGMIPQLIDDIPQEAVMYLINALAFEAEWENPYRSNQQSTGEFIREDGTADTAEFLSGTEGCYLSDEHATGFIKYYQDRSFAFVALLPNEDVSLQDYLESLDGAHFQKLLADCEETSVRTMLPKFHVSWKAELSAVLRQLGMTLAFDPEHADLSALGTADGNLYISRVLHQTDLSLTEKGTKASAATSVEISVKGVHLVEKEVLLNRPFVYFLIDCETGIPFFAGTLEKINP